MMLVVCWPAISLVDLLGFVVFAVPGGAAGRNLL
jgi:hypothetical protein